MTASPVGSDDLDWMVRLLGERRESLVEFAPEFWRAAPEATAHHHAYLEHLLSEGGAKAFRTDRAVLVAVPQGEGWLIDDAHAPGTGWAAGDGAALWNALDGVVHGATVRFVCPTYEVERAEFARVAGLSLAESWWLLEVPAASGGAADMQVALAGAEGITVAAPPVYAPRGPVLYLPAPLDARVALQDAIARAPQLGCPAIVVNQVAGDDVLARALTDAGFRRHCDYFTGLVDSL